MSRLYTINGVDYPSVTTVLGILGKGDGLLYWSVGLAIDYIRNNRGLGLSLDDLLDGAKKNWMITKDEAMDIGSEIHNLIEVYIKHGKDALGKYRPEVENGFLAFLEWERVHQVKWLHSELQVVSDVHGFAGTLDAICIYEGKRYVIDFKSSKDFYDGYDMQIAAYKLAAREMGYDTDGMGILRLDKITGMPEFKDYSDKQDRHETSWLKLLDFFYHQKRRQLKNNKHAIQYHQKIKPIN